MICLYLIEIARCFEGENYEKYDKKNDIDIRNYGISGNDSFWRNKSLYDEKKKKGHNIGK